MVRFAVLVLAGLIAPKVKAQAPYAIGWQASYGGSSIDVAHGVVEAPGGYIVLGHTGSSDGHVTGFQGQRDVWLVRLDESGGLLWQRAYGGTGVDRAYGIGAMQDGGFAFVGESYSSNGDLTGNQGANDAWVVKLNEMGLISWQRSFGGAGWDVANAVVEAGNGDLFVVGETRSTGGDVSGQHGDGTTGDFWVLRLTPEGQIIWQRALGGMQNEIAWGICVLPDDGVIVVGESNSQDGDVVGSHGIKDGWVCRLSAAGDLLWSRAVGGSLEDMLYGVSPLADGGALMVGETRSNDGDVYGGHGGYDAWVVRLSSTGGVVWQRTLGGTQNDRFNAICTVGNGLFLLAGSTLSSNGNPSMFHGSEDCWVLMMNDAGAILGERCYGGSQSERAFAIAAPASGGAIFAGQSTSVDGDATQNQGVTDFWVVRLEDYSGYLENAVGLVRLFPNPASDRVRVSLPNTRRAEVLVHDAQGRLMLATMLGGPEAWLHVRGLSPGAYHVRIVAEGISRSEVLLVE